MMKQLLLPEKIRDELIAYMMTKPYAEVAQGIAILRALAEAPIQSPALQSDSEK